MQNKLPLQKKLNVLVSVIGHIIVLQTFKIKHYKYISVEKLKLCRVIGYINVALQAIKFTE